MEGERDCCADSRLRTRRSRCFSSSAEAEAAGPRSPRLAVSSLDCVSAAASAALRTPESVVSPPPPCGCCSAPGGGNVASKHATGTPGRASKARSPRTSSGPSPTRSGRSRSSRGGRGRWSMLTAGLAHARLARDLSERSLSCETDGRGVCAGRAGEGSGRGTRRILASRGSFERSRTKASEETEDAARGARTGGGARRTAPGARASRGIARRRDRPLPRRRAVCARGTERSGGRPRGAPNAEETPVGSRRPRRRRGEISASRRGLPPPPDFVQYMPPIDRGPTPRPDRRARRPPLPMSDPNARKILLVGDVLGRLGALYKRVASVHASPSGPFEALFCLRIFLK